jgi:hypothetical protein
VLDSRSCTRHTRSSTNTAAPGFNFKVEFARARPPIPIPIPIPIPSPAPAPAPGAVRVHFLERFFRFWFWSILRFTL